MAEGENGAATIDAPKPQILLDSNGFPMYRRPSAAPRQQAQKGRIQLRFKLVNNDRQEFMKTFDLFTDTDPRDEHWKALLTEAITWLQTPAKFANKVLQGADGGMWLVDATAWEAEIDPASLNYVLAQQESISRRIRDRLDLPMDGSPPNLLANQFTLEQENRRRAEQGLPPRPGGDPGMGDMRVAQQSFVGQKQVRL